MLQLETVCSSTNFDMADVKLTYNDYTVAWISALGDVELPAAMAMLDQQHTSLPGQGNDSNNYVLGRIGDHNVILACLPSGTTGMNSAATVAANIVRSFPKLRFGLLVGVGGGAPGTTSVEDRDDIRLGDIVVSTPEGDSGMTNLITLRIAKPFGLKLTGYLGGVIQYDFGKTVEDGRFLHTGTLNKPPAVIRSAVSKVRASHRLIPNDIKGSIDKVLENHPSLKGTFESPGSAKDKLYYFDYKHPAGNRSCDNYNAEQIVHREPRLSNNPKIHYGTIGSANQVMKDGVTRERLRKERGIICFEMEAAGLMDDFPCLIIRGICDYSDTHKNKVWQPYAAMTAAVYAKELLSNIAPEDVEGTQKTADVVRGS